jgi:hypothetical protein
VYTLGKDNSRADALSQRLDIARTKEITKSTILKVNQDRSLRLAKAINNIIIKVGYKPLKEFKETII